MLVGEQRISGYLSLQDKGTTPKRLTKTRSTKVRAGHDGANQKFQNVKPKNERRCPLGEPGGNFIGGTRNFEKRNFIGELVFSHGRLPKIATTRLHGYKVAKGVRRSTICIAFNDLVWVFVA